MPHWCAAEISAQGDVLPRAGFRAPGLACLFVGKVEQSLPGAAGNLILSAPKRDCLPSDLPERTERRKTFQDLHDIVPLFSDLRVEGERQAAHSHLDFELAIRVPVGRNGFSFIVQTQDVCAGDRKVAQPAFDLRAVMRRRFKKVDI